MALMLKAARIWQRKLHSNDMQIQAINKAFSWYMLQRETPDKKS